MDWSPRGAALGVALSGLASCIGASAADAALIQGSLSVEVVALDPGITTVALGDRFDIDFTVDDAATDDDLSTGGGHFPGLLTSFVVTADPGNTGSWAPSGTFDLGPASSFVTNAFGEGYTFQVRGTGFPAGGDLGGLPFFDIDLSFGWPGDITDSGSGDSFAAQFGGAFDPAQATLRGDGIRFQSGSDHSTAMFVPEPSRTLLLAIGLLVTWRMKKARSWAPLVLAALALLPTPTRAGIPVLFDGGAPEGNGNGIETTIRVLANDFVLTQAGSVERVQFWASTPAAWDGTIEYFFFESSGSLPADVPLVSGDAADISQTPSGVSGESIFFFDLEAPLPLAAGPRYWFGLHLKQSFADDGNYSFWSTTTADVGLTSASAEGGNFAAWGSAPDDEAFVLYGTLPEPGAALQALAGIGVLLACRRLRRGARAR